MSEAVLAVLAVAACVYGASAMSKLRGQQAYRSYRAGLLQTRFVTNSSLPVFAACLVSCEVAVAACSAGALAAVAISAPGAVIIAVLALGVGSALTVVLAAGVAVVMKRGIAARCACFGSSSGQQLGGAHLVRNGLLLALLALGCACAAVGRGSLGGPALAASLVWITAGLVVAAILIRWEDLAELFTPLTPG